jgi:hypothetical protein
MRTIKGRSGFKALILLLVVILSRSSWCHAESVQADIFNGGFLEEITEGFDHTLKIISYGTYQDIAESTNNPENNFIQLPTYLGRGEVRPDLSLILRRLELSAKPRMMIEWRKWDKGNRAGEKDWDDDWFLNEWLARISLIENLFLSYGRENLQWGPSYLVSPSNPFFRDNGRDNPIAETAGMDFARLVWLPHESWSISFIANTSKGRQKSLFRNFEKTFALKLDYTGREAYASLILSHKNRDRDRLGLFAGWTATDALLLYCEGDIAQGSNALYPVRASNPLTLTMSSRDRDDSSIGGTFLMGGAYTLELGPTFTLEYIYSSPGYTDEEAEAYYKLRRNASDSFTSKGPLTGLAQWTLSRTADPDLRLLRQHYAMLQYVDTGINDVLDMTFRWTQCIDDGSGQFLSIVEYYWGDHVKFFSLGSINAGRDNRVFGNTFDHQWMIGLEYTF